MEQGDAGWQAARVAQRAEHTENLRNMVAMMNRMIDEEQAAQAAADVDNMSYEQLQALGDTIGKVQVRAGLLCKTMARAQSHARGNSRWRVATCTRRTMQRVSCNAHRGHVACLRVRPLVGRWCC